MKARLKDPDIARLFENTFPNTLGEVHLLAMSVFAILWRGIRHHREVFQLGEYCICIFLTKPEGRITHTSL